MRCHDPVGPQTRRHLMSPKIVLSRVLHFSCVLFISTDGSIDRFHLHRLDVFQFQATKVIRVTQLA